MLTSQPGSLTCVSAFFIVFFFTAPACGEVLGGRPPGHTWSLALSLPHAAPSSLILAATRQQSTSRAETTHDGVESTQAAHQQHAVPCMGTKPPAEYAERVRCVWTALTVSLLCESCPPPSTCNGISGAGGCCSGSAACSTAASLQCEGRPAAAAPSAQ